MGIDGKDDNTNDGNGGSDNDAEDDDDGVRVYAGPMSHGVPCVGYVIQEPNRPGRKVVICGDTNSSRSLDKIARHADVVVHEATNTFLHALDHKDANLRSVSREAIFHGHSTPQMAGDFCQRIQAKRLILNHFSARYTGDQSMESISIMTRIEQQAIKASGLSRSNVAAAWDFMIFPIPKVKDTTSLDGGNSDDDDDK